MALIAPKEFIVVDQEGRERQFLISKFPAVDGRKIVANYPLTALPKVGDYASNEETMLLLMSYVAVLVGEQETRLSTKALINNHVGDWETLARLEAAMLEYNCSFFLKGKISTFLEEWARTIPQKVTEILTASLAQSFPKEKPPSTN